ncbi:helix-turn-helix transcriptional regulator [Granulicella sibirica]|uniref:Transcriptional regulator, DeoR family n=1 Tax=Granulicella sibirica TaxID=2479048 RepID=A0A4V1L5P0_9BACT|nr:WYL domain-containing protein [Granulicella sibirica]RXH56434.1 Transcriptional regulator, DeoR family [Granulicella sibirica]
MKADRLLSALMLLQAHGRLSSRELAERLEISVRTAHRDMEALCVAGIPVSAMRGYKGGWELERGWRTKVPGLDEHELRALLMAQPNTLGDPQMVAAAERAYSKLLAAMPGAMRMRAASIQARLHIDSSGWRPHSEDLSSLPAVQDAVAADAKMTFLYTKADGTTGPRTVDPLGIVCKQGVWYLVARASAGLRTYRVGRMRDAVALPLTFERPADFDLGRYWKNSMVRLDPTEQRYTARLAMEVAAALHLRRWCSITTAALPDGTLISDGFEVVDVVFESFAQAHFVTLGYGPRAYVIGPEELRTKVEADLEAVQSGRGR